MNKLYEGIKGLSEFHSLVENGISHRKMNLNYIIDTIDYNVDEIEDRIYNLLFEITKGQDDIVQIEDRYLKPFNFILLKKRIGIYVFDDVDMFNPFSYEYFKTQHGLNFREHREKLMNELKQKLIDIDLLDGVIIIWTRVFKGELFNKEWNKVMDSGKLHETMEKELEKIKRRRKHLYMKKKRYIEKHELIKYDEKLLTRENISEVLKSVENIINNGNKCIVQLNMKTQDKISKFIQRINPKQVFLNDFDIYKIYSFDYVKKLYYSQVKQDTEESMQLVQRVLVESIKDVNLNGIKFELNHDLRFDKKGVDEPNDDLRLVVSNDGSCIMMNKHIPVFFVGKVDGYTVIYLNYQNTTEHFQQNTLDWFMNKFPVWSWNVDVVFSKDRYFLMYKKHDENDLRKYKQYVVEFIKKWLITFKFMKLVRGGKVKIGW